MILAQGPPSRAARATDAGSHSATLRLGALPPRIHGLSKLMYDNTATVLPGASCAGQGARTLHLSVHRTSMGCGGSKSAGGAPADAPGHHGEPGMSVAATNKHMLALQANGGGSVLLSAGAGREATPVAPRAVADGAVSHVPSRGGSYLIAFGAQEEHYTLGSAFQHPEPLPATRQVYIVQPEGGKVLRVSYGCAGAACS